MISPAREAGTFRENDPFSDGKSHDRPDRLAHTTVFEKRSGWCATVPSITK